MGRNKNCFIVFYAKTTLILLLCLVGASIGYLTLSIEIFFLRSWTYALKLRRKKNQIYSWRIFALTFCGIAFMCGIQTKWKFKIFPSFAKATGTEFYWARSTILDRFADCLIFHCDYFCRKKVNLNWLIAKNVQRELSSCKNSDVN